MSIIKSSVIRSILYIIYRFIFRKQFLIGYSDKFKLKMQFKTEDGGGREIFKKGTYEDENSTFLVNSLKLKPGDTFIDIGGNIGWYSILLDKYFPVIKIYAFEPDSVNAECFRYNMKINKSANIDLIEKGVSDKSGQQTMYMYKNSNKGRNSLLPINNYGTVEIEVSTLDDTVQEKKIRNIRFIKIDIEGYEYFALKGAQNALKDVELLLMEFAPTYMRKGKVNPEDVLSLVKENNFKPFQLINGRLHHLSFDQLIIQEKNVDVYFLKENQKIIHSNLIE